MTSGKIGRYLTYALGEIVLVVLGILLALKINAWNEERVEAQTISSYYGRIAIELTTEEQRIAAYLKRMKGVQALNRRTLRLARSESPDSLAALQETLGGLGTAWTYRINMPVTDEFLSQEFLKHIENDSIKIGFQLLASRRQSIAKINDYTWEQYNRSIEPFFHKHINYSDVALDRYQGLLEKGGPPTDFSLLKDNMEFWNIVTFKLEGLSMEALYLNQTVDDFHWLREQLQEALEDLDSK